MYSRLRPLLFRLDAEQAHAFSLNLLRLVGALPPLQALLKSWYPTLPKGMSAFSLTFSNPVGLAAGYDKDGLAWRGLACLGFSHIEIGTVTLRPQPGNDRPRLFRLPEDQAIINRLGFPGRGAQFVVRQLSINRPSGLVLGVNLGKNKETPLEAAAQDYLELMRLFGPLADYLAINVSSPNTAGLRRLQGREALESLMLVLTDEREASAVTLGKRTPLLVKLAPDLTNEELDDAVGVLLDLKVDGVIATNTTLTRTGVISGLASESGGLSGQPLSVRSLECLQRVVARTQGQLPVISVGGIGTPADAQARLDAGATLVQLYTGLVYAGPGLVSQIVKNLH